MPVDPVFPPPPPTPEQVSGMVEMPKPKVNSAVRISMEMNRTQFEQFLIDAVLKSAGYPGAAVQGKTLAIAMTPDGNFDQVVIEMEVKPVPAIPRVASLSLPDQPDEVVMNKRNLTPRERAEQGLIRKRAQASLTSPRGGVPGIDAGNARAAGSAASLPQSDEPLDDGDEAPFQELDDALNAPDPELAHIPDDDDLD